MQEARDHGGMNSGPAPTPPPLNPELITGPANGTIHQVQKRFQQLPVTSAMTSFLGNKHGLAKLTLQPGVLETLAGPPAAEMRLQGSSSDGHGTFCRIPYDVTDLMLRLPIPPQLPGP